LGAGGNLDAAVFNSRHCSGAWPISQVAPASLDFRHLQYLLLLYTLLCSGKAMMAYLLGIMALTPSATVAADEGKE
jgi:hypothetical protein